LISVAGSLRKRGPDAASAAARFGFGCRPARRAPDLGIDNGATLTTTALRQVTFRPRP
jgi:hypothetical protein